MKIFYLNCARRLKRKVNTTYPLRNWLVNFLKEKKVDLVCLSESSNYDIRKSLPDMFPYSCVIEPPIYKMGFNICSQFEFTYESISIENDNSITAKYRADIHSNTNVKVI